MYHILIGVLRGFVVCGNQQALSKNVKFRDNYNYIFEIPYKNVYYISQLLFKALFNLLTNNTRLIILVINYINHAYVFELA